MKRAKVEKYLAHKITAIVFILLTNTYLYYVTLYLYLFTLYQQACIAFNAQVI